MENQSDVRLQNNPVKAWSPDLRPSSSRWRPAGKGGIAGTLQQPAEYIAEEAWKYAEGERKVQALAWKAQKEVPIWFKKKIVKYYWFNKYYRAKTFSEKKFRPKNGNSELQKSAKFRTYQSKRQYKNNKSTKFRNRQYCRRSDGSYGFCSADRKHY